MVAQAGDSESHSLFHVAAETSLEGVLKYLSLLVISLAILEILLSKLEHKAKSRKVHTEMLAKVYRELMILGVISFISVIASEIGLDKSTSDFLEFESAHIMIFFTALLLTVQAIGIYFTLRFINILHDWLEEMNYTSFLTYMQQYNATTAGKKLRVVRWIRNYLAQVYSTVKIFRAYFMKKHKLPLTFPFSKYLQEAQDRQVDMMIEIDPLIWIIHIAIWWTLWAIQTRLATALGYDSGGEYDGLCSMCFYFSALLILSAIHGIVILVLHRRKEELLVVTGCRARECSEASLERLAWQEQQRRDFGGKEMDSLESIQHRTSVIQEDSTKNNATVHDHWLENFSISSIVSKCLGRKSVSSYTEYRSPIPKRGGNRRPAIKRHNSLRSTVQFEPKNYRFILKLLLLLNAFFQSFYFAGFLHLTLINFKGSLGSVIGLLFPIPLLVNSLCLQPIIFQKLLVLTAIWDVDSEIIGLLLEGMVDAMLMKEELGKRLHMRLLDNSQTLEELMDMLQEFDVNNDGCVDPEELQHILQSFGLQLSPYRFKALLSCLKNGSEQVCYTDIYDMVHNAAVAANTAAAAPTPSTPKPIQHTKVSL